MTISEEKNNLRAKMRVLLRQKRDFEELSIKAGNLVAEKIIKTDFYKMAEYVFLYMACGGEIDVLRLLTNSINDGKKVLLPKVHDGTCEMDFYFIDEKKSVQNQLTKGAFGILEPIDSLEKFDFSSSSDKKNILMIVPGLAFSKKGQRLGKGKGFYDRYLEKLKKNNFSFYTIGVAYNEQVFENIPTEKTDFILDSVISD